MSGEVRYVRLLPYNEKLGHLRRQHSIRYNGRYHKFNEPGVWVKVPIALANHLEKARQHPTMEGSPRVFDVCTEREARSIDTRAKAERDAAKAKVEPTVDTARSVSEIEVAGEGRGDLSLDEVSHARFSALEEVAARASGEPEPEPKPAPNPRSRSRKSSKRKK